MLFQDYLSGLPDIDHLNGLNVLDAQGQVIHHIAALPGKLGSLKIYHALLLQFNGQLNFNAASQGLMWFAEQVADAQAQPGKHPNIDFLMQVQQQQLCYTLQAL